MTVKIVNREEFFSTPKVIKHIFSLFRDSRHIIIYFEDGSELCTPLYEARQYPFIIDYSQEDFNFKGKQLIDASCEYLGEFRSRVILTLKKDDHIEGFTILFSEGSRVTLLFLQKEN